MSSETSDPAARWLALAGEAREIAHELSDPEAKLVLLSIAQVYEHMHKRANDRKEKKDSDIKE